MVGLATRNSVSNANPAIKHMFGKKGLINLIVNNTGLDYGLAKVIVFANSVFFLDIVFQRLRG